jgi:hypothetical protein
MSLISPLNPSISLSNFSISFLDLTISSKHVVPLPFELLSPLTFCSSSADNVDPAGCRKLCPSNNPIPVEYKLVSDSESAMSANLVLAVSLGLDAKCERGEEGDESQGGVLVLVRGSRRSNLLLLLVCTGGEGWEYILLVVRRSGVEGASTVQRRFGAREVSRRCQGVLLIEAGDVSGRRLLEDSRGVGDTAEDCMASFPDVRRLESWESFLDACRLVDGGVKNSVSRVGDAEEDERWRT